MQEEVEAVGVGVDVLTFVLEGGSSPSRQSPNQPGYLHDDVEVGEEDVVVTVGAGTGEVVCLALDVVFSPLSSLQPNQPGVLQVDVEDVDVVFEEVLVWEVLSSRQPHQPGVLHVSVRVREIVLLLLVEVDVGLWV